MELNHTIGALREISPTSKISVSKSIVAGAVWLVALFCWNNMSARLMSLN